MVNFVDKKLAALLHLFGARPPVKILSTVIYFSCILWHIILSPLFYISQLHIMSVDLSISDTNVIISAKSKSSEVYIG